MATTRTATIIGVTGLIGGLLYRHLLSDPYFDTIRLLVRRPFEHSDEKTEVKLIDFNDPESFRLGLEGTDTLFVAIGTTQSKVKGDEAAYRRIDFDIPVQAARFAQANGCNQFLLVSSVGADQRSGNFYLRLKGETEAAVRETGIPSISIFRPSLLLGKRLESRPGERFGQALMPAVSFLMGGRWRRYRAIEADTVAAAMLAASKERKTGVRFYEYDDIRKLAGI